MANPRYTFWVDPLANRLVAGWANPLVSNKVVFKQGDTASVTIRKVESQTWQQGSMVEIPFTGDVTVTIGNRNARPIAGYWTLTYGESTTDFLSFDACQEDVERLLNGLVDIAIAGGVTVIQLYGDSYKVVFNETGVREELTADSIGLMPDSISSIVSAKIGSPTQQAVFIVTLRQNDLAEQGFWEAEEPVEAVAAQVNAYTWEFYLTNDPQGGYFSIAFNGDAPIEIPCYTRLQDIQALIGTDYTVSQWGDFRWRVVENTQTAFDLSIDSSDNIISFHGVTGTLSFTSSSIVEATSAQQKVDAFMEITEEVASVNNILLNKPVSILAQVTR